MVLCNLTVSVAYFLVCSFVKATIVCKTHYKVCLQHNLGQEESLPFPALLPKFLNFTMMSFVFLSDVAKLNASLPVTHRVL